MTKTQDKSTKLDTTTTDVYFSYYLMDKSIFNWNLTIEGNVAIVS